MIVTQTPRLNIRQFSPEEEKMYVALFEDQLVTQHLPKRTPEEHTNIFRGMFAEYEAGKVPGKWGIFIAGDNDFAGMCLLRPYKENPEQIEIGYAIPRKYWGKGYGTEMAKALVAYTWANTAIPEIIAITTLTNAASQKVLENAGLLRMNNVVSNGEEVAFFKLKRPE